METTPEVRQPEPAQTRDGHRITLLATIDGPGDVAGALAAGAQGVGLFRTDSLVPADDAGGDGTSEDEQVAIYRAVFEAFGPDRPVIVRLATSAASASCP